MLQDYAQLAKDAAPFLPSQTVLKEGSRSSSSAHFPGFTKVKNVYITGHSDGTIGVWDMTCPFLIPVLFLKEQVKSFRMSFFGECRSFKVLTGVCLSRLITIYLHAEEQH